MNASHASVPGLLHSDPQGPVFIFGTGPRSGGNILLRTISASRHILIWNGSGGALNHLLECARQMELASDSAANSIIRRGKSQSGANETRLEPGDDILPHVSGLCLPGKHIRRAFRHFFATLYGAPSKTHGFQRWGLLINQGNQFTADMLKFVFPRAKFIFLVRHPLDCLGQLKTGKAAPRDEWGNAVPHRRRLEWFASNWSRLAGDFDRIGYGMKVRYEDVLSGEQELSVISDFLSMPVDCMPLALPDRSTPPEPPRKSLSPDELSRLQPLVQEQMLRWNYK